MRVLLTGATGFVGSHLAHALRLAGHDVTCAVRSINRAEVRLPGFQYKRINYAEMLEPEQWLPHLRDIDVVINAVGVFNEKGNEMFSVLHYRVPCALFRACTFAKISRVVQISALGADDHTGIEFLESKNRADSFLLQQPLRGVVLQPAPVFGVNGASAALFARLAALPILSLPEGTSQLQPVHIDDVSAALLRLMDNDRCGRIAAVGPQLLTVATYIATLRDALKRRPALTFTLPLTVIRAAYRLFRSPWMNPATFELLKHSKPVAVDQFRDLVGRPLIEPTAFVRDNAEWRQSLWLDIYLGLLKYSIAALWIGTGIVSLWFYPIDDSLDLLARAGFGKPRGLPLLYMAAFLDMALGIAIVTMRKHRRFLWLFQALVVLGYTAIISWRLPEFWAHPYGPVLKNLPILAAIGLLYSQERRP